MQRLLFLLIALISLPAMGQSAGEREVLSLSARKFGWLVRKKADSLENILDERVQYIHSNGWIQNKREVLDDMVSGKLVYQNVTVKEATARLYDKSAVVTGLGTFEGINSGNNFKMDLRYTEVYVRTSKGWMLVSRHSNRMP